MVLVFATILASGCVTVANKRVEMRAGDVAKYYPQIRQIIVEEAANNGYSTLTSEIKPSDQSGWNGRLYFSTKTGYGTDQLTVDFERIGEKVQMDINGGGAVGNPKQAAESIIARIRAIR